MKRTPYTIVFAPVKKYQLIGQICQRFNLTQNVPYTRSFCVIEKKSFNINCILSTVPSLQNIAIQRLHQQDVLKIIFFTSNLILTLISKYFYL